MKTTQWWVNYEYETGMPICAGPFGSRTVAEQFAVAVAGKDKLRKLQINMTETSDEEE